jgi:hypothetical protein
MGQVQRREGYTLDLDSTVFERYGKQEGALNGHNPRKHGPPSHHPLLAVLGEAHFFLHRWLRSGGPRGQPRNQLRRGGVSQKSSRAVGTAPEDPPTPS